MATTVDNTVGEVLDASAALLNDVAKSNYTNAAMMPFLNMALRELQEIFQLNNIPVTDTVSAVINVPAGITAVGFSPAIVVPNTPYLPDDLIEPKMLWEREEDINPFVPMTKLDMLPRQQEGVELNQFIWYTWQSNEIRFMAANQDNDIKMDYIRRLFVTVTDADDEIAVTNCLSFLQYRTASLCAEFLGENKTRATELNNDAGLALDRSIGIGTKGRQNITIRHRPFRASYKQRSNQ